MSTLSLRNRLLLAATLTVIAFLGLAGVALDRAYIASARVAQKNQMKSLILLVLAAMEVDRDGRIEMPEALAESRLNAPHSGLYALVLGPTGELAWRSASAIGTDFSSIRVEHPGIETFGQFGDSLRSPFYHSFGVDWEFAPEQAARFTVVVIQQSESFIDFIEAHRRQLLFWLGSAGLFLLLVQALLLRWGLIPLGRVAHELDQIEHARQDRIEGRYPREIAQLSERINLFIESERSNLKRYRDTLGDLAHSLKTPLAVIRGTLDDPREVDRSAVDDHLERMEKIVDYQLKRAASSQFSVLHGATDVESVVNKLTASLQKVYIDRGLSIEKSVEAGVRFHGDESDLYELLGNLLDNACKWAVKRVRVTVRGISDPDGVRDGLEMTIEDDGPGIAVADREAVLERGVRADEQVPGQGIGLAVAGEIVRRYQGALVIEDSELDGTAIRIRVPPAGRSAA